MNYFPFHVGDYAAHTAHLEPLEDLAYRRLLDQYYMREGPLPADVQTTAKLVRMRSMAADVESVLREFFTLTDAGWVHARCDQEIEHMRDKQAKARASAEISASIRKANAEKRRAAAERTLAQAQADAELPTPTPTPTPIKREKKERASAPPPEDVDPQTWKDWVALRTAKRATASETAVSEARKQAEKAGMSLDAFLRVWCARGSQGLEAEWLKPHERGRPAVASEPAWRTEQRERNEAFLGPAAARKTATVIDLEAHDAATLRLG